MTSSSNTCPTITKVQAPPVYRGNDVPFPVRFRDSSGDPVDITNDTVVFTVKTSKSTTTNAYQQTNTTHTNPTDGLTTFTIPSATSATFAPYTTMVWDVYWERASAEDVTVMEGTFDVEEPVRSPT